MKTLEIKKIEVDGDCASVTFQGGAEIGADDFDLEQLGTDICYLSSFREMIMVAGTVTLKSGDSITDDFGGKPIFGKLRKDAIKTNMSITKESDYRDAFENKISGDF